MKKFLVLSSWSAAIGSMLIAAFAVVGCDDSSSAPAGPNDEPGVESCSSVEQGSSSSGKAKSSSSDTQSGEKQSSSSKKTGKSSSSVDDASSSSEIGCKTETEDNCEYGELIDDRDGQTYKAVKIGAQWWMAENLNYGTVNSDCYNDNSANCTKYGRLYTWAAAMDSAGTWSTNGKGCGYGSKCSPTGIIRGICPEGWHLPDTTEWKTLFTAVGGQDSAGTALKSTGGWFNDGNGTDAFGFSALPAGYRGNDGGYYHEGYYAYFWSSTEYSSIYAYYMDLYYYYDYAYLYDGSKYYGFSVRCVKD